VTTKKSAKKKGRPKSTFSAIVMVRYTEDQKAFLQQEAKSQGRDMASHIRFLTFEGRKTSSK
jgi:hypothetical protein